MTAHIDVGVTGFINGNCLIQDGQRYAGAAVVSNTENTCGGPHLAGMSTQEVELAALKMSVELRKDIKVISATSCGVTILPIMLQSLHIKPQPLPVTVTFTSGHRMGTFSKTRDNSCDIHSFSVRANPFL